MLGGDPLVLFLDELPPYLEYAVAVPVGNADLGVVTTAALANLFVAVADMDNVCLVLSDLAGSNFSGGQAALEAAFNRAVQGLTGKLGVSPYRSRRSIPTATISITSCANGF